jgi:co-chaperonin GroES (HSP10)
MQSKYEAFGSHILVKEEASQKQLGGIILTESDKRKLRVASAIVISAGQDCKGIKEGDRIWYKQGQSNGIDLDGDLTHRVVQYGSVIIVSDPSEDGQE